LEKPLLEIEVYDLEEDPDEQINLVPGDPALSKGLAGFMKAHYRQRKSGETRKAKVNENIRRQLKALGYIK